MDIVDMGVLFFYIFCCCLLWFIFCCPFWFLYDFSSISHVLDPIRVAFLGLLKKIQNKSVTASICRFLIEPALALFYLSISGVTSEVTWKPFCGPRYMLNRFLRIRVINVVYVSVMR